eukprot:369320_1
MMMVPRNHMMRWKSTFFKESGKDYVAYKGHKYLKVLYDYKNKATEKYRCVHRVSGCTTTLVFERRDGDVKLVQITNNPHCCNSKHFGTDDITRIEGIERIKDSLPFTSRKRAYEDEVLNDITFAESVYGFDDVINKIRRVPTELPSGPTSIADI